MIFAKWSIFLFSVVLIISIDTSCYALRTIGKTATLTCTGPRITSTTTAATTTAAAGLQLTRNLVEALLQLAVGGALGQQLGPPALQRAPGLCDVEELHHAAAVHRVQFVALRDFMIWEA